ncbi:unnamed protein product, partial [Vitis vinifera]|uniref:Uncharacterized protein n=1 Tax=Vitis vinifera TaxID=29760 RepID=D7T1W9_VITVI
MLIKNFNFHETHSKSFGQTKSTMGISFQLRKPLLGIDEKGSNNRSMIENQATKRQKIEGGFLHKVSHLKHQAFLVHKIPKKVNICIKKYTPVLQLLFQESLT